MAGLRCQPVTALLFRDDPRCAQCTARVTALDADGVRLDRTVFYPRGGGQPGDTGTLQREDGGTVAITDTIWGADGEVLHLADDAAILAVGDTVTGAIDWPRRHRLMRMHSCLHLLSALVSGAVTGGKVDEYKSRLDFDLPESVPDKTALTESLNSLIAEDHPVAPRWITEDELDSDPALVKTLSVAPPRGAGRVRLIEIPGIDVQACGGTHVARTAEIGRVRVSRVESKGRRNRRITVVLDE